MFGLIGIPGITFNVWNYSMQTIQSLNGLNIEISMMDKLRDMCFAYALLQLETFQGFSANWINDCWLLSDFDWSSIITLHNYIPVPHLDIRLMLSTKNGTQSILGVCCAV